MSKQPGEAGNNATSDLQRPAEPERSPLEQPADQPAAQGWAPERTADTGPTGRGPVERTGWRALWLGAGALLLAIFFYPLGLVTGLAALITGIRAKRRARRQQGIAPGAVAGIVMGSIGLFFSSLSLGLTLVIAPELRGYDRCVSGANTNTDKQTCQDEWFPKIEDKFNLPRGSMSRYGTFF